MSKKPPFRPRAKMIVLVVFPGFQLLDLSGPATAFEIASHFRQGAYRLRVAATMPGLVPSSSGVAVPAEQLRLAADTILVAGGQGTKAAMGDETLIAALKRAAKRVRRIASVCSGALVLAQAGLLDGRRATTHWRRAPGMAREFPNVSLDPDCIYVRDGNVWTSAGVSAGIDLALAMIAEDLGEDVATEVAREMVVYAKRPGGQAQHSALLDIDAHAARFGALNAWIRGNLHENLSVERLAARASMSARNFARAYAQETGVTPAKAVERLRAEAARSWLEQGMPIQQISRRAGFGDPERMRRAFLRHYGAPPSALRRTLRRA